VVDRQLIKISESQQHSALADAKEELTAYAIKALDEKYGDLAAERLKQALECLVRGVYIYYLLLISIVKSLVCNVLKASIVPVPTSLIYVEKHPRRLSH
jgi:hypothetical protein